MKGTLKKVIPILFFVPFVIGSIGYFMSGNGFTNSLYASFALYFTNPISDSYNIWIEIARWTAPLATASVILIVFENAWRNVIWWFQCLSGDSVAVYTDSDFKIIFDKKTKVFYSGRKVKRAAKSHIIIMDSDVESLKFYEDNKAKLADRSIYIGLREIDFGLMKENRKVNFFDINGAISRLLWKKVKLWERQKESMSVVIWGKGYSTDNILCYGLLLNLFAPEQQITYHMVGNDLFQVKHPQLPLMNNDKIIFHAENDFDNWEIVRRAEIIIIAEEVSAAMMQSFAVNGRNAQIYYYSHNAGDVGDCLQLTNLIPFGRDEEIYTDENIRQEKLVEEAKNLNLKYAKKYNGEKDWHALSGFLKWSNISSADFTHVLTELVKNNPMYADETLAELEHIRWCRFYYLNYWVYGKLPDGRRKDTDRKIHTCLCPYNELSQEDKKKDKDIIEEVRKSIREK